MGKYLQEIEISPCNLYEKAKEKKFIEETRCIIYAVNSCLKRNVYSIYGKIAVILWPNEILNANSVPRYEYDTMSSVCIINIPYDIDLYTSTLNQADRNWIIYNILKNAFSSLPKEVELDGNILINILDEVRDRGFIYTKETKCKVSSPSKDISARLQYLFDSTGIHVNALIDRNGSDQAYTLSIGDYSIYDTCLILDVSAKLVFHDEDTLEFQPNNNYFKPVKQSISHIK